MSCATTVKVSAVREKVNYKFREIEIGISIYMDDISVAGGPDEVRKRIRKCTRIEVEKKMKCSLSKTTYRVVKTGK